MMEYRLLATDLDGTLLNAKKEISFENVVAINRALDMGKQVIFSTGRALGEVKQFFPLFPQMRYVLCESGGLLYDWQEQRVISRQVLAPDITRAVLHYAQPRDIMIQIMTNGESVISENSIAVLEHYRNEYLREHFLHHVRLVEDIAAYCKEHAYLAEKICLYHPDTTARVQSLQQLEQLEVTAAFSERTSLELTPIGVDKGKGLCKLCKELHIPLEQVIAIGDAPNDLAVLQTAGLAIAVDNASEEIKQVCHAVVADNEHNGVKEAIENWLCKTRNKPLLAYQPV